MHLGDHVSGIYELGVSNQQMMTGRQYAKRWLELNEVKKKDFKETIEDIHDFTELEDYFDKPIRTYSAGMKAKLFGVATAISANIFLIDEVLFVGDMYLPTKC